jgi:hypothetical protein
MDRFTIRNLELYHSYNPNAVTLLDVIKNAFANGRLLKRWLALPLKDSNKIQSPSGCFLFAGKSSGSIAKKCNIKLSKFRPT